MLSLKQRTINGLTWSLIERLSVQGLHFVITIIIARILLPSDYGLVGMMSIFIAISFSLIDSGFSAALIQKKDRNQTDYSTIFYFNLAMSIALYLLIVFFTPRIVSFYDEPRLLLLAKVIAINIVIQSFSIIQTTYYSINLDFKTQARASLLSVIVSGVIGIVLAYNGYGVWALVWQTITRNTINVILLWVYSKWRPDFCFSKESLKSLFPFGSKLLVAGFLYTVFENIYLVIIGRYFSSKDLGYYVKAKNISNLPSSTLTSVILRVTFPVLSSIQDDEVRLISMYRKIVRSTIYLTFPLIILLAVISEPLILLLLTEKWHASVLYLKMLCFVMLWYPLNEININLLKVKGRSDSILILSIVRILITVLALVVTIKYGLTALIFGQIISSAVIFLIIHFYTCRLVNVKAVTLLILVVHFLLFLITIGFTVNLIERFNMSNIITLIAEAALFIILFLFYSRYMFNREFKEIASLVKERIKYSTTRLR